MKILSAFLVVALAAGGTGAVEGLDVETVTAVYQDRAGFLWVGSREGLVRFDGYASVRFRHDVGDPRSLSDNDIRTVFEDQAGNLWIGTNTGGVNRLDRATGRFESFRHDSAEPRSLVHDSVYAFAEDRDGKLWVGTQGGLCRFDPASRTFESFPAGPGGPGGNYVVSLLIDREGVLWIATVGGGLNRRDPVDGRFTTLGRPHSYDIAEGPGTTLWVATDVGLQRLDRATGAFAPVPFDGEPPSKTDIVTALDHSADGTLWASTFESGLWSLAPSGSTLQRQPIQSELDASKHHRYLCLLGDAGGAIWAGTWGAGMVRVSPAARQFSTVDARSGLERSPDLDVSAVLEGKQGALWIGTFGSIGKILRLDGAGHVTVHEADVAVLSMLEGRDGKLWLGTTSGLRQLDPAAGTISIREQIGATWVWRIVEDRAGRLWAAAGERGLFGSRPDGSFDRFTHDPADPGSLSDTYVTALLEDTRGTLWVGTRSGGLNARDPATGRFTRHVPDPGDPRSISHHNVSAILEDRRGTLWVGTAGGGLDRIDPGAGDGRPTFVRFGEKDGLVDDNVMSLLEDDDGTLWIGTRRGLSRFDPKGSTFANYGESDGLRSTEFSYGAAASGRTRLYFGSHRGLLAVRRGTPMPVRSPSPTVVTSIGTMSGPAGEGVPPWSLERLEIPYGEVLAVEAAVLDFGDRRRHRYAYRLDGLHRDWVDLGTRREITFTHLDPGSYTLRVRGRNDQGVWSETPVAVRLDVVPPFWMTGWFRVFALLSVLGLAWTWHLRRTGTLERRNRELFELKEQRERALEEARTIQGELRIAYGRLRGLTRRLEAAKEEERKHIAREMHDEMGTALTTMKLNLQLLGGAGPEEGARRVTDSIGLIDRMIGHVRELSLDLRPPLLDELGLAAALRGYLEALSRRSGIGIDLRADGVPAELPDDVAIAAFRVAQEAVTNVLRHGGASRVTVALSSDRAQLDLAVCDDGRGFDVAAAFERAGSGHHLGLLGMRERVEAMGGTLVVESAPGHGTRVHARLPLEEGRTP